MKFFKTLIALALISSPAFANPIPSNKVKFGDGNDTTKIIEVNNGDVNKPQLRYNSATNQWEFSNDGTNFLAVGSGGGAQGGLNLLTNGQFEQGSSEWTATGSSTLVINQVSEDGNSGRWDATASGEALDSDLQDVKKIVADRTGVISMEYSWPSGTAGDLLLQAVDDLSTILTEVEVPVSSSDEWATLFGVFPMPPETRQVRWRLIASSTATNPSAIDVDNAYIGSDNRSVKVSTAKLKGHLRWKNGTGACFWTNSGGSFTSNSDCDSDIIGEITEPSSEIPGFDVPILEPGQYTLSVTGNMWNTATTAKDCGFRLKKGSTILDHTAPEDGNNGPIQHTAMTGAFVVTSTESNVSFEIDTAVAGSPTCRIDSSNTSVNGGSYLDFTLVRYPLASELSTPFDQAGWMVDANMGGALVSLGTSAQASYTGMTNASLDLVVNSDRGSAGALQACATTEESSGLTCSGNESVGISFTVPSAGIYKVTAQFSHRLSIAPSTGANTTFQLVETANNSQTVIQEGLGKQKHSLFNVATNTTDSVEAYKLDGYFKFDSAGKKTIRLFYEQAVSGSISNSQLDIDRSATEGQVDMHWHVEPAVRQTSGINFASSVSTANQDGDRIAHAYINGISGTPVVVTESGTWIDSITDNGTGDYTINVTSGTWSAPPVCPQTGGAGNTRAEVQPGHSASAIQVTVRDTTTDALNDERFHIMCIGPK